MESNSSTSEQQQDLINLTFSLNPLRVSTRRTPLFVSSIVLLAALAICTIDRSLVIPFGPLGMMAAIYNLVLFYKMEREPVPAHWLAAVQRSPLVSDQLKATLAKQNSERGYVDGLALRRVAAHLAFASLRQQG